jgi:hypothetical protein
MPVGLRIVLIGTTTIMQSAVLTIYNDSYFDCIYATNMTQNTTSNQEQDQEHREWEVKPAVEVSGINAELGEVVQQVFARWCVEVLVVKKGKQKS